MIEVERKFKLTPEARTRVQEIARFVSESTNRDCYYDRKDYFLLKQDWWLRERNGIFELKTVMRKTSTALLHTYHETTNPEETAKILSLKNSKTADFKAILDHAGYRPYIKIST